MHRFWNSVTEPLLQILDPQSIVEVGVSTGVQTKLLLQFAKEHGAVVHAIDTLIECPLEEFEREFPAQLRFHHAASLDALRALPLCDVYLIDGDHNWYTVLHELRAIRERSTGHRHPVILFHDTGWPYARRDQYYDIANIPPSGQQPSAIAGVVPGQMDLFQDGINAHYTHAQQEGGPHNGVLTAIEEYLAQSAVPLSFVEVHGLHGLGILYPTELETDNMAFHAFLQSLHPTRPLASHISALEAHRLTALRDVAMLLHAHEDLQQQLNVSTRNLLQTQRALSEATPGPSARQAIADAEKERAAMVGLVDRMSTSMSWRITAPLRRVQGVLRTWPPRRIWHTALRDIRTLLNALRGSAVDLVSVEKPIQPSTTPATVAMQWDINHLTASIETLESMLRLSPRPQYGFIIGNGTIPSGVAERIQGQETMQWIDAQEKNWRSVTAEHCGGDVVVLLEAGVMLHPFYLTCGMEALYHRPAAGISYSNWHEIHTRRLYQVPDMSSTVIDRQFLHSACMLRREAFTQAIYAGSSTWTDIITDIVQQGWNVVRNRGLVFLPHTEEAALNEQPHATLCLALSGRTWMWEETRTFLERQTYPHHQIHLIILDTSQDDAFGLMVRSWLSSCDYVHQTYRRETVGPAALADQPRAEAAQTMSDACAAIYNCFARMVHTPMVFTLEDDVIPPDDAFVRLARTLIRRNAATVSGAYRHRLEPRLIAWYWSEKDRPVDVPSCGQGIEAVGGTGFGCLALNGSLFSKTVFRSGPPWRNFDTNFFHDLVLINQEQALIDWDCPCRHYVDIHHYVTPL